VTTKGSHTPLEKKPGCGETPGPTGMPARRAGGCPCAIGAAPPVMSNLNTTLINFTTHVLQNFTINNHNHATKFCDFQLKFSLDQLHETTNTTI
jgi:hypothetical protein